MNDLTEAGEVLEVTNVKEYPVSTKKEYQATPVNMMMLIVSMVAIAVGLFYLNSWFEQTKSRMHSKNNGRVPAVGISASNVVDTSCKTELYSKDGQSGLLDLLHKKMKVTEEYELIGYSLDSEKPSKADQSFVSTGSMRTMDDIEHNTLNSHSTYSLQQTSSKKWGGLTNLFSQEQKPLL